MGKFCSNKAVKYSWKMSTTVFLWPFYGYPDTTRHTTLALRDQRDTVRDRGIAIAAPQEIQHYHFETRVVQWETVSCINSV